MVIYSYKQLEHGFNILSTNSGYWRLDNDYKRKYMILEDAVKNFEQLTFETKPYVFDILKFMLQASNRIFKTPVPIYSAAGTPIEDDHGTIYFSR